ncbi:glycosyltransferase family 4 protein [Gammaproteobacteria bacterium]|nr:glycosyltransferase family 4 protein [Gammaproteobacteria bacterium]
MTKVLLITQWFDPEPTFKGLLFARELIGRGFQVEVLTGFPNYPGGKIYNGYKVRLLQKDMIDGVDIARVALYPSHDRSVIRRLFNYASFSISALFYGLFKAKRPDVIYAYHPPLTVGVVAVLLRVFRKIPVVYDIQDMWPDTLKATGIVKNKIVLRAISSLCDWVYRRVDKIVVLSPGFKELLVTRSVKESKIDVIYNWCSEEALGSSIARKSVDFGAPENFYILFAGNVGKAQGLDSILGAAELLKTVAPELFFVILGGGIDIDRLKGIAEQRGIVNVLFLPPVPFDEVGSYLKSADALLVHLKKDPLFSITIPSKTQAYMAAGRPILMAVDGDAANLVRRSECGLVAESDNPESIAQAALRLFSADSDTLADMAENGMRYYHEVLSINIGSTKFSQLFERLAHDRKEH